MKKVFYIVLCALLVLLSVPTAALAEDAEPLTDISQLEPYFPDENFRKVVFDALNEAGLVGNVSETTGKSIEEIIAMFRGELNASGKNIKDAYGLQYLRKAEYVNLFDNIIGDWTRINPGGIYDKDYYGYVDAGEFHNVTWNIGRNPITRLPANFGGRLVIEQPASKSSYYPDKDIAEAKAFIRDSASQRFDTVFDVACATILGTSEDNDYELDGNVKIITVNVSKVSEDLDSQHPGIGCALLKKPAVAQNNKFMRVTNILLNETLRLGVGTKAVIHYDTVDDSGGVPGPGSQSFKYYLYPEITIYDRVTLTHHDTGSVMLNKTDSETGEPLIGAEYALYRGDTKLDGTYTSDEDGMVLVQGLAAGSYSLRETKAPQGYQLDSSPLPFDIEDPAYAHGTVDGGYQTVQASDGSQATAGTDEVFIAGKGTPDLGLHIQATDPGKQFSVILHYSSLATTDSERANGKADEKPYTRVFTSAEEAARDINAMKNDNRVAGPITIDVEYAPTVNLTQSNQPLSSDPPPSDPPQPSDPPPSDPPKPDGAAPKTGDVHSAVPYYLMAAGALILAFAAARKGSVKEQ